MSNVCLTMIVRNESKTIARCLRAARQHITHWSIVDTGSTDDTREIIREELKGIPGVLHERPWKNFGHNRTESFQLAQQWLTARCSAVSSKSWCLLLDADHELHSEHHPKQAYPQTPNNQPPHLHANRRSFRFLQQKLQRRYDAHKSTPQWHCPHRACDSLYQDILDGCEGQG